MPENKKPITLEAVMDLLDKAGLSVEGLRRLAAYCDSGGCQGGCPSGCAPSCQTCSGGKSNGVIAGTELGRPVIEDIIAQLQTLIPRIPKQ